MHSVPSKRTRTTGRYFFGSGSNFSVAPSATWRFTLLLRWTGPVRNTPPVTTTRPPPAALAAAIAWRIASVQSVLPSALAPKSVIGKSFAGNVGALMRSRMPGTTTSHGLTRLAATALLGAVSVGSVAHATSDNNNAQGMNGVSFMGKGAAGKVDSDTYP